MNSPTPGQWWSLWNRSAIPAFREVTSFGAGFVILTPGQKLENSSCSHDFLTRGEMKETHRLSLILRDVLSIPMMLANPIE
jgi:hypothetical protein